MAVRLPRLQVNTRPQGNVVICLKPAGSDRGPRTARRPAGLDAVAIRGGVPEVLAAKVYELALEVEVEGRDPFRQRRNRCGYASLLTS